MAVAAPNRQPLYAKIAIARKQLVDMDEEAYRALLENKFKVRSASKLSFAQLSSLVQILAEMGAVFAQPGKRLSNTKVTTKARPDWIEVKEGDPHVDQKRAILAIWKKLGYSMSSLETRVKRGIGVESFAWLHDEKKISALLSDLQRREVTFDKKAILALWEQLGHPRASLDALVRRWFGVESFALLRSGSQVSMLLSELEFRRPAFDPMTSAALDE
jgi:phage gp16-like protein